MDVVVASMMGKWPGEGLMVEMGEMGVEGKRVKHQSAVVAVGCCCCWLLLLLVAVVTISKKVTPSCNAPVFEDVTY